MLACRRAGRRVGRGAGRRVGRRNWRRVGRDLAEGDGTEMKPFEGFDRLGDPIEGGSLVPKKGNGAVLEHAPHTSPAARCLARRIGRRTGLNRLNGDEAFEPGRT